MQNRRASVFLGALFPVPVVSTALAFAYGPELLNPAQFPEIRGSLLCLRVPEDAMLPGDTGSHTGESFPNLQAPLLHTFPLPSVSHPQSCTHSAGPLHPL